MKDLLEYIVKSLVSKPDTVIIDQTSDNGIVNLELTVDPKDMGMIIGKGGQTIHAIRKLLTVRAISENVRVNLHLTEPEGGIPQDQQSHESDEELNQSEETESEGK